MALSMTGYGRGVYATAGYSITIDLKSINHRYTEIYVKIPRAYSFLEEKIRREITAKIARGKIEATVTIEKFLTEDSCVKLNLPIVTSYLNAVKTLQDNFNFADSLKLDSLINLPEVFQLTQPEEDQEELAKIVETALHEAIKALIDMRRHEGDELSKALAGKLDLLEKYRNDILTLAPGVVSSYQEKLSKRIQELTDGLEIEPSRLAMEVAIFADKSDITEEIVRLESHIQQFGQVLKLNEPVGRRLDFLTQELNREINTIGSKANDLKITQIVIDFKTELEKIREQIQNME